ncbi:MBL fold metallo-hydrolase [Megasphaera cerevisiae]|nr:MBL fold metallo-hydrolase [Megasphaera cerevisiae]
MKKEWKFSENTVSVSDMCPFSYTPACLTDPLTQSNCYIIAHDKQALLIDPNNAPLIRSYLEAQHLLLEYVLLTHEHCDHMAGLNELRQAYKVQVIASKACSDGIQSTTLNMSRIMESYLYFKSKGSLRVSYPKFTCLAADITFDNSYLFTWYGHLFRCLPAAGHTPGSTCIIMDSALLFSGDYFIPGEEVITRLPGGSDELYEQVGKKALRALPAPIRTYPGHGESFLLTQEVKQTYGLY